MQVAPEELELDIGRYCSDAELDDLGDAIDNASDQDRATWLVSEGKRIAAIVPVEVLEFYQAATDPRVTAVGRHHRQPESARS